MVESRARNTLIYLLINWPVETHMYAIGMKREVVVCLHNAWLPHIIISREVYQDMTHLYQNIDQFKTAI